MSHLCTQARWARQLALVAWLVAGSTAFAGKTAWLVRPLYPGQEALVERAEKAIERLLLPEDRKDAVIGRVELAQALKGYAPAELPCFAVSVRCADPVDTFVAALGFDRVVLVQGGQDEAGFTFKVVSYEPSSRRATPASATNAVLERALFGAVARVVPVAATLEVTSTPEGATVFVDDVKVGVTPLTTQVLPGERSVRLDLKLHQPVDETVVIPIRGRARLERALEKVAARILVTASPPGTEILIDGVSAGTDRVDRGIAPGDHTVRLVAEQHKAFEQAITVRADQQFTLDKTLEPLVAPPQLLVVTPPAEDDPLQLKPFPGELQVAAPAPGPTAPPPGPPAPPPSLEEQAYERKAYFHVSAEMAFLARPTLVGRRFGAQGFGRTTVIDNGSGGPASLALVGASAEYGTFGRHFGVTVFGLSYLTNLSAWGMEVGHEAGLGQETAMGVPGPVRLSGVRAHLGVLRALHPQVRFAVWRFTFALQAGFEFRAGQILGADPDGVSVFYKDGFVPLEVLAAGRLNVRLAIADGLFLHLQGHYSQYLAGERAVNADGTGDFGSASAYGFNLGFGYGF